MNEMNGCFSQLHNKERVKREREGVWGEFPERVLYVQVSVLEVIWFKRVRTTRVKE